MTGVKTHPEERFNITVDMTKTGPFSGGQSFKVYNRPTNCWPELMFKTLKDKIELYPNQTVRVLELSKCRY